jgi:hypothetical protein
MPKFLMLDFGSFEYAQSGAGLIISQRKTSNKMKSTPAPLERAE